MVEAKGDRGDERQRVDDRRRQSSIKKVSDAVSEQQLRPNDDRECESRSIGNILRIASPWERHRDREEDLSDAHE